MASFWPRAPPPSMLHRHAGMARLKARARSCRASSSSRALGSCRVGTRNLPEFLSTVFVLIVVPWPTVVFVVSRAVGLGRRAALLTVIGNAMGLAVKVAMVALGVGTLLAESNTPRP